MMEELEREVERDRECVCVYFFCVCVINSYLKTYVECNSNLFSFHSNGIRIKIKEREFGCTKTYFTFLCLTKD